MKNKLRKTLMLIAIVNFIGIMLEGNIVRADSENAIINDSVKKDRLQTIKEKGLIAVVSPLNDVSYFYVDANTKKVTGIEGDIITEIAKRLGINKIEIKNLPFSNLLETLNTDDSTDVASGGIFITPEREKLVTFTQPIYTASDEVVVPTFSNINFKSDLKNSVVGIEKGTVYENLAERWKKENLIKDTVAFKNSTELLNAINSKNVDAGIVDSVIVKYSLLKDKLPLRTLKDYTPELTGKVGIAVKKDDRALLQALNEKISEMKADGALYAILVENGLDKSNMV